MEEPFKIKNIAHLHIILASQSPRRKELLSKLGLEFNTQTIDVEEDFPASLQGSEIVEFLAKKKADAFPIKPQQLVITADTIVWHENQLFGKPKNIADAKAMLRQLSGHTHEVFTGVGLTTTYKQRIFSVRSEVRFAQLSDEEIDYYIDTYRPLDKAGAYGIQEWIGFVGIESISGSFWNVMGLPIQRLYQELRNF